MMYSKQCKNISNNLFYKIANDIASLGIEVNGTKEQVGVKIDYSVETLEKNAYEWINKIFEVSERNIRDDIMGIVYKSKGFSYSDSCSYSVIDYEDDDNAFSLLKLKKSYDSVTRRQYTSFISSLNCMCFTQLLDDKLFIYARSSDVFNKLALDILLMIEYCRRYDLEIKSICFFICSAHVYDEDIKRLENV